VTLLSIFYTTLICHKYAIQTNNSLLLLLNSNL